VEVDTFLAYISDPISASVEVPGTGFAPEAITVSGSGTVRNLEGPLVDLGTLGDLPAFLTETGERLILDVQGPAGSVELSLYPDLTGTIALVLRPTRFNASSTFRFNVSSQTSQKTGCAPRTTIACTGDGNVRAGTITSSPGSSSREPRARCSAAVPEFTAITFLAPRNSASSCSNAAVIAPFPTQRSSITWATASNSS